MDFMFFAFRWNVMFLIREFPDTELMLYLIDCYLLLADESAPGFAALHVYVCAALLLRFRDALLALNDATDTLLLLQALPTHDWTLRDMKDLVAEALLLRRHDQRAQQLVAQRLAQHPDALVAL